MKNNLFFDKNEEIDYEKLIELNNHLGWFNEIGKFGIKNHYADASAKTADDRVVNIELKNRNMVLSDDMLVLSGMSSSNRPYTADNVYIEDHKVSDLMLDYIANGMIPLYINFLADGNVLVFNLSKLTKRPVRNVNLKIKTKGYDSIEFGNRQGLLLEDAFIVDKNYVVIRNSKWTRKKS